MLGIEGVRQWPYKAVAAALEVIPRTLIQNCGADVGKFYFMIYNV